MVCFDPIVPIVILDESICPSAISLAMDEVTINA